MIYQDVRNEVESLVGFELTDEAWSYLADQGFVRGNDKSKLSAQNGHIASAKLNGKRPFRIRGHVKKRLAFRQAHMPAIGREFDVDTGFTTESNDRSIGQSVRLNLSIRAVEIVVHPLNQGIGKGCQNPGQTKNQSGQQKSVKI